MNKTRGGIFLLLLAILLIGSGCAAWNAEPYGQHGLIDIGGSKAETIEKKVVKAEVKKPELAVKKPAKKVMKKPTKAIKTIATTKKEKSVADNDNKKSATKKRSPAWCIFCVIQTQEVTTK